MRKMSICKQCLIISLAILISQCNNNCSQQRLLQQSSTNNNYPIKRTTDYNYQEINLKLNKDQQLLQPVRAFTKGIHSDAYPAIAQMSPVTNIRTRQISTVMCRLVSSPSHKPYQQLSKINHKIKNKTEWESIVKDNSVIYKLEDIKKLQYALDMEVINDTLVVIFEDGQVIFYNKSVHILNQIARKQLLAGDKQIKLSLGKILSSKDFGVFVSANQMIYINPRNFQVRVLKGYEKTLNLYTSLLLKDNRTIFTAHGKYGITQYKLNQNSLEVKKISDFSLFTEDENANRKTVSVVDLIQMTHIMGGGQDKNILAILDSHFGLLKVKIDKISQQSQTTREVKVQQTQMKTQNCRMMVLHLSHIYVSCPQILIYNPVQNKVDKDVMLSSLPLQILSSQQDLTIISHSSFHTLQTCSKTILRGFTNGMTFHHTVIFGDHYVSINDLSIYVWKISYPEYLIACKGDPKFEGLNRFQLTLTSVCDSHNKKSTDQCCSESFIVKLQIYDSEKGVHIVQRVGLAVIILSVIFSSLFIYFKKRRLYSTYIQLQEQSEISMVQDKQNYNPKIQATQESLSGNLQQKQKSTVNGQFQMREK